jgi:hypothetical protein
VYSSCVFSFRYPKKESAVQAAAAVPAEEHCHRRHHDDGNPVLCVHVEETAIVSGSLHSPSFQELVSVWANVVPGAF